MKKHFRPIVVFVILASTMLACSSSFIKVVGTPLPSPIQGNSQNEAVTDKPSSLLPRTFYYLADGQVFRMERDGKTVTQITHERVNVTDYDVSVVDGSVAYVVNNQLFLVNADGSNRHLLVDGGHDPVFSLDGETLAYAHHGLSLYNVATSVSKLVLQDEFYRPEKYSPDGVKLLMTISVPNTDATHDVIYYPATNSVVRFNSADGAFFCCGDEEWTQDGLSLYAANPTVGMLSPGLWRVDATSGNVTTLLLTDAGGGNFNLADEPYLAPGGQLYFFFASAPAGSDGMTPLQMVHSAPDGVTGRAILRPETFASLNEALWAPDASFVITAKAPADTIYAGGVIELYYTDSTKGVISLLPFGQQMKWGP